MEENKESPSTTEHGECCEECQKTCKRTPGKQFTAMESLSGVLDYLFTGVKGLSGFSDGKIFQFSVFSVFFQFFKASSLREDEPGVLSGFSQTSKVTG